MSGAALIRDRLRDAGVTLALDADHNLEWQAEADPPDDLLAEIKRHKPALVALLQAEAANDPGEPDPAFEAAEREALMAEETAPMMPPAEHRAAVAGLMRAALPPMRGSLLANVPGAYACRECQRGIWVSPSWPGALPTVCRQCEMGERP